MELGLTVVAMLLLGLGLFQAWLLWYVRRGHARLDHRIDESLDAEDLVEFQERLKALLQQAGEAGAELVQTLEKRQAGVDKVLEKAREAELKLLSRLQAMERLADGVARRLESAEARPKEAAAPKARPKSIPAKGAPRPTTPVAPLPPRETTPVTVERRPVPPQPDPPATAAMGSPPPARYQRIYDLADQGLSREQIAREAGVLAGELDLILNLRGPRRPKS